MITSSMLSSGAPRVPPGDGWRTIWRLAIREVTCAGLLPGATKPSWSRCEPASACRQRTSPSCESTSRMITESALCLAQDADKITVGGGSWTPSSAMGDLLLPRLTAHAGLSFNLETQPKKAALAGTP